MQYRARPVENRDLGRRLSRHARDRAFDGRSQQEVDLPSHEVPAPLAAHQCPSCHQPQTKIRRVLGDGKVGSTSFVCSRMECALGIDVSKLETWVVE
jgi:hypothetical protein